ncbi:MAG: hypothetical protein K9N23_00190 [Akkermansiaceae bacterium]|nr:hypothetical protein [Akkermansiaceae bacterium]MCF7730068.1 hypothetical protein [Akkermansiaceae bacterium]
MPISIRHRSPALLVSAVAILLWTVMSTPLQADESQGYLNRFWQTSDGMPSNSVNDIGKDRDGFLWIATGAGVARFDGLRFEVFYTRDGLPDTQLRCLHVDRRNRVWVGTRRGVAYRENGAWVIPSGFPNEPVFSLGEGTDGSIWVGTFIGCWKWDDGGFTKINLGDITPDVRSFLGEGGSGMWILTRDNLCLWHPETPGTVEPVPGPWENKDLRDLARDHAGRVIVCGTGVLLRREGDHWEDLNPMIPNGDQNANLACAVAADDTIWLATRNHGLTFLHDAATGVIDSTGDLSLNDVRSVMTDANGMIMAGTNGGGINILRRRPFDTYSTNEGLGGTVTSALAIDRQGEILAGTDGGGIFRKENGRFRPCYRNSGLPGDGLIWSLCVGVDDSIWVGTYQDGLFRIRGDQVEKITPATGFSGNPIPALGGTRDGGVLVGTSSEGVRKWKGGQLDPDLSGPPGEGFVVYDVLEDHLGRIWVATGEQGLWVFENGGWRETTRSVGMPELLPAVIHEGGDGDLWVGSLGQGLARYHENQWTAWDVRDGMVSDTICQILEDDSGNLWLGSDRGLQRVSIAVLGAYHRDESGLPMESMLFGRTDGRIAHPAVQRGTRQPGGPRRRWLPLVFAGLGCDPGGSNKVSQIHPPAIRPN